MAIIKTTLVTGATGDTFVSLGTTAVLYSVRVAGTAVLVGAVQVKNGTTVQETLAAASAIGLDRPYYGALFDQGIRINLANAGDTVQVIWGPA